MTFFNRVKGMLDNFVSSKPDNSNDQGKLSSSEEGELQERRVQFAESDQLSENKSEHDGWYCWIDRLISLEPNKAIEKLEADINELEEELVQLKDEGRLKSNTEIDLKLVKCLAQHFNNPEKIIKELKQYTENKDRKQVNRIKVHIVLIKYFAEQTKKELTQETNEFIEGIKIKDKEEKGRRSPEEKNPQSVYTISRKNIIKQYNEVAYDQKIKELRNLILDAKNNFDDDVYRRLLIRVNNCIVGNNSNYAGSSTDLIVNPDDIDATWNLAGYVNHEVNGEIKKTFAHAKKLRVCMKELLSISHGDFDQILCDVKDLMEPVLKQSDKELNPTVNTPKKDSENDIKTTTEMTKKLLVFSWGGTITNRSLVKHFQTKGLGDYNLNKEGTATQQDIKEFCEEEETGIKNEEKLKHVLKNAFEQGIEVGIASFSHYLRTAEYIVKNHLGLINEQAKNVKIAVNSINTVTYDGSDFPRHCAKNIHILYLLKQYKARYGTLPQEVMLVDDNGYNIEHLGRFGTVMDELLQKEINDLFGVIERDITEIEITAKELKGIKFIGVKVPIKRITKTDTSADDGYLDRVAEWIGIDYKQQIESQKETTTMSTTEKVNSHSEAVETPEHIPAAHSSDNHSKTQKKSDNKKQGVRFAENIATTVSYHSNDLPQNLHDQSTNCDAESKQPQQSPVVVEVPSPTVNTPEEGIHNKPNLQTTHHRPQSKPNVYDNKGFGKEIMIVVGAIIGTIIGATIAYFAGAVTLPIIAAIAVFSAAVGALIGYGIAEICEKVSREKQSDPKMGTLTALREVITPKWLNGNVDVAI